MNTHCAICRRPYGMQPEDRAALAQDDHYCVDCAVMACQILESIRNHFERVGINTSIVVSAQTTPEQMAASPS